MLLDCFGRCGLEKDELDQLLQTLCTQGTPVTLISVDSGAIGRGRFRLFSNGLVTVDVLDKPKQVTCKPLTQCVFVFRLGNRGCVFLALVESFCSDTTPETLVVRAPNQIASENRSAFRVPIFQDNSPLVRIKQNGHTIGTPQAIDISLTGILVEFPSEDVPEIDVDTKVQIELGLDDIEIDLVGDVRRRDGQRYGILFPETLKGAHVEPPDGLKTIVRKLEKIWLQRRVT